MKLRCLWHERSLARLALEGNPLPPGSRLQRHLTQCPDCRRAWDEFALLTAELPSTLADSLPAPSFVLPPLPMRAAGSPELRLTFPALALSGMLLAAVAGGRFLQRPAGPGASPDSTSPPPASAFAGLPGKAGARKNTSLPAKPASVAQNDTPHYPASHAAETAMPAPVSVSFEYASLARADTAPQETVPPEAWGGLGAWYAAQGDYACAADAYARAYQEQPDPDFAMAAGQSAESAGGVNDALDYYLQALKMSTEQQSYPEEDETWNETLITPCSEPCSY